jgi:hypothetical protein
LPRPGAIVISICLPCGQAITSHIFGPELASWCGYHSCIRRPETLKDALLLPFMSISKPRKRPADYFTRIPLSNYPATQIIHL